VLANFVEKVDKLTFAVPLHVVQDFELGSDARVLEDAREVFADALQVALHLALCHTRPLAAPSCGITNTARGAANERDGLQTVFRESQHGNNRHQVSGVQGARRWIKPAVESCSSVKRSRRGHRRVGRHHAAPNKGCKPTRHPIDIVWVKSVFFKREWAARLPQPH
jgi:hypothetical protein